jgi:transposase
MIIAVGVDTHKHQHLAVAVDALGQLLAEVTITATLAGYRELLTWISGLKGEVRVGIEGAGSFGAGLCEYLQGEGITVFEVERPKRRERRTGKSDRLDALLAAKKVLANDGLSTPRGHGKRVALQMLLVAYRSVISERSRLYNQLQALHVGAPATLRERVGSARNGATLARRLTGMRARPSGSLQENTTLQVLRDIANRTRALDTQAAAYTRQIDTLTRELAPTLMDEPGVGPICAAKLIAFNRRASGARPRSQGPTAPPRNPPRQAKPSVTDSAAEATDKSTQRSTRSRSHAPSTTHPAVPTSNAASRKARPSERP